MREHDSVAEALLELVSAELVPSVGLEHLGDRTRIRFTESDEFEAIARIDPAQEIRYEIEIHHAVPEVVIVALRAMAENETCMSLMGAGSASGVGLDDEERFLNYVLLASLGFVVFHELTHVAGGHLGCWNDRFLGGGPSSEVRETGHFGITGPPAGRHPKQAQLFGEMVELEADGAAFELVHEFRRDLAALVASGEPREDASSRPVDDCLSRAALVGSLIAVALVEASRSGDPGRSQFTETRLLNLLTRPLAGALDAYRKIEEGQEKVSYESDEAREILTSTLREVILPSQLVVSDVIPLARDWRLREDANAFTRSLVDLVAKGSSEASPGGARLTRLMREKPWLIETLSSYREAAWWKLPGAAEQDTSGGHAT